MKIRQNLLKNTVKETEGARGCVLWQKGLTKDGYGRVRNPFTKNGEVHAHRLMFMVVNKCKQLPVKDGTGRLLQVSHLCHQKRCINFDHLTLEPNTTNMDRAACNKQQTSTRHHQPHCIF